MATLDDELKEALENFWDDRAIPSESSSSSSIDDFVDSLESITAVDMLVTAEKIIGQKVPLTVIKAGGYSTKDEFVNQLSSAIIEWHNKS